MTTRFRRRRRRRSSSSRSSSRQRDPLRLVKRARRSNAYVLSAMHPASGPVRGNGLAAEADFSLNSRQPPGLFDTISTRNSASVRLAGNSSFLAQLMGHQGVYIKGQPILWGVDSDDFIASCVLVVLALVIPFLARRSASSTRQSLRNKLGVGSVFYSPYFQY